MQTIDTIRTRLETATELNPTLDACWEAFEFIGQTTAAYFDPASSLYYAFMLADSAAYQGRTVMGLSPSSPSGLGEDLECPAPRVTGEDEAAEMLAGLAALLADRLRAAGASAAEEGDRDRCERGATAAEEIRGLLARSG